MFSLKMKNVVSAEAFGLIEYDTPMFTAHRSIGLYSILLLAVNIGIYQS